jgi:hypothetical protein
MTKKSIYLAIAFIFICEYCWAGPEPNWSSNVAENMYVPSAARNVSYSSSDGALKVSYRAGICYPAKSTIQAASALMRSRGWSRMIYDPENLGVPLPPEYPQNEHSWLGFYPWTAYWRDNSGNVVFYEYSYDVNPKLSAMDYFEAVKRSCSLLGTVVYLRPDAYKKMIRAVDETKKSE